jgi:hypothetical protein
MCGGNDALEPCLKIISQQFVVLQTRSQLLLTLATIVLTITGFSGPRIAASGVFARMSMALGLLLTLAAVLMLLLNLRIRWLTQFQGSDAQTILTDIIAYREGKRRAYLIIITALMAGLASYVAAVIAFLITGGTAPL